MIYLQFNTERRSTWVFTRDEYDNMKRWSDVDLPDTAHAQCFMFDTDNRAMVLAHANTIMALMRHGAHPTIADVLGTSYEVYEVSPFR